MTETALSMAVLQVIAIIAALIVTGIIMLSIKVFSSLNISELSWLVVLIIMFPVIPIHEFIHAVFFKGGPLSKNIIFGFYPRQIPSNAIVQNCGIKTYYKVSEV